ncbi:hypothetical protein MF1_00140 [Bartonella quintana]|nr:hypothetical protein MF1_00140 [Bartonella quintana]
MSIVNFIAIAPFSSSFKITGSQEAGKKKNVNQQKTSAVANAQRGKKNFNMPMRYEWRDAFLKTSLKDDFLQKGNFVEKISE